MDSCFSWRHALHVARVTIAVSIIILLASCRSHVRPDGPPNFYVDETKISNATPRIEPRAKYGNMPYYYVFGKRYDTMKSCQNYEATGVASWYGTKFHERKTSSGERYDMLAMTAAHKTLPLPTYLEVTNLKNHRKIIVKVNDRGPFSGNRLIDLSYVAAKKLGMIGHGTTYVHIKAINPYTFGRRVMFAKSKPIMPSFRKIMKNVKQTQSVQIYKISQFRNNSFAMTKQVHSQIVHTKFNKVVYLQVGAFKSRANAEKLKQNLAAHVVMPVKIALPKNRDQLYRVQIGPIKDQLTADKISIRLKGMGIKSNVTYGA